MLVGLGPVEVTLQSYLPLFQATRSGGCVVLVGLGHIQSYLPLLQATRSGGCVVLVGLGPAEVTYRVILLCFRPPALEVVLC